MLRERPEKDTRNWNLVPILDIPVARPVFSLPGADGSVCPSRVEEAHISVSFDSVVQGEKEVCTVGAESFK